MEKLAVYGTDKMYGMLQITQVQNKKMFSE